MKFLMRFSMLFLICFSLFGCVGPEMLISPIINGIIMWKDGEARQYVNFSSDAVHNATMRALRDMDFKILRNDPPIDSNYHVIAGANNRFKVKIVKIEKNITEILIRVDFLGDHKYAELLYEKINEELKTVDYDHHGKISDF